MWGKFAKFEFKNHGPARQVPKLKNMEIENLKSAIRDVPDFPSKGIMFRDLTTMIKDAEALHVMSDAITSMYRDKGITKVVGIESRR